MSPDGDRPYDWINDSLQILNTHHKQSLNNTYSVGGNLGLFLSISSSGAESMKYGCSISEETYHGLMLPCGFRSPNYPKCPLIYSTVAYGSVLLIFSGRRQKNERRVLIIWVENEKWKLFSSRMAFPFCSCTFLIFGCFSFRISQASELHPSLIFPFMCSSLRSISTDIFERTFTLLSLLKWPQYCEPFAAVTTVKQLIFSWWDFFRWGLSPFASSYSIELSR